MEIMDGVMRVASASHKRAVMATPFSSYLELKSRDITCRRLEVFVSHIIIFFHRRVVAYDIP